MKRRLCDNDNLIMVTDKLRRRTRIVWRCNHCDYMMLEPCFESAEEYYDEEYRKKFSDILDNNEESPETVFDSRLNYQQDRLSVISKYFDKNKDFLEIGSSAGQFLYWIKGRFNSITGIELSKSCVEFCKNKIREGDYYTIPIEKIDWNDRKFDYIVAFQVLEHI